ncbi:MAG: hypothetical protein MI725_13830, partial [Pirellulales bacterium]|nr:hypothetical protein [Pirellulales bacterium]
MSLEIRLLTEDRFADWDDYVYACEPGTFCHLSGWKPLLESVYGLKTHYIYAEAGGRICGVLPLAEIRSLLFGHTLISTPFCVYGGPCADSEIILSGLTEEAARIARNLRVDYLEFRQMEDCVGHWPGKDFYFGFRKGISADP